MKARKSGRQSRTGSQASQRVRGDQMVQGAAVKAGSAQDIVPCDPTRLAPFNSYGQPDFVARGYYVDQPFCCQDCGKPEVWRAAQQKWWFEVAQGYVYARAVRCSACRHRERDRVAEARRAQQQGMAKKNVS